MTNSFPNASLSSSPEERRMLLLLVDNNKWEADNLRQAILRMQPFWTVEVTRNPEETITRLREMMGNRLPDIVSVDLGLDPDPNQPWIGLKLLRELQRSFGGLRLVVHSAQPVNNEVLHEIMALPASYILTRDDDAVMALVTMLPLLARGFLIFSSQPASRFPQAIVTRPDPLKDEDWELLKHLATPPYRPYAEIGKDIGFTERAIASRAQRMAVTLNDKGFIDIDHDSGTDPNRYRPKLQQFYREHRVRYNRP
jgi:DNA-binding NarL/FixJ family response regulator